MSTRCLVLLLVFFLGLQTQVSLSRNVNKMSCFVSTFVFETFTFFQRKCQQDVLFYFLFSFWHFNHNSPSPHQAQPILQKR